MNEKEQEFYSLMYASALQAWHQRDDLLRRQMEQVKTLYLIRGLPGSGKSTLAKSLAPDTFFEADDFFVENNEYRFDPARLSNAHEDCRMRVEESMLRSASDATRRVIAVANTFSKQWEAQPYFDLAKAYKFSVFVIECQNDFGSVHEVPEKKINEMKKRWDSIEI